MWLSVLPLIATEAQQGLVAAASQSLEHSGTLPIATLDTVDDCHHTLGHHCHHVTVVEKQWTIADGHTNCHSGRHTSPTPTDWAIVSYSTLQTEYCTQHTAHWLLHTEYCTQQSAHFGLNSRRASSDIGTLGHSRWLGLRGWIYHHKTMTRPNVVTFSLNTKHNVLLRVRVKEDNLGKLQIYIKSDLLTRKKR